MGCEIHVANTYRVEYNSTKASFNKQAEAVNRFLEKHCPGLSWEGDDVDYSETLYVPRADLAGLIGYIVTNTDEYDKWAMLYGITETVDEFVAILADWIVNSDPHNDFVVLAWF